jgi:hypothetical protein
VDKVLVTNMAALGTKYGDALPTVQSAIDGLLEADRARGLTARLLALDSVQNMQECGAQAVAVHDDPEQAKRAIDAVYRELQPDYLVILGAVDVVPHVPLRNPAASAGGDEDEVVPSDLPYACEAAYSVEPADFTAVTRVVGRIPDVTGGSDTAYLTGVLGTAARATARAQSDYGSCLGITAAVWTASSQLSLASVFGSPGDLKVVPPEGYQWPAPLLSRRAHFVNCHGAPADWRYYGQPEGEQVYPEAHDAAYLAGKLTVGTVAAAECCYGAELYDPGPTGAASAGICNTYLANGAYGFFGSSTIAFGPSDSNDWADVLCQRFWQHLLAGESLGAATLRARQDYIAAKATLDPIDLKTLAQFAIMGDPSIHPVAVPRPDAPVPEPGAREEVLAAELGSQRLGRAERRRSLFATGLSLGGSVAVATREAPSAPSAEVAAALRSLAERAGLDEPAALSFEVDQPPSIVDALHGMPLAEAAPSRVHVLIAATDRPEAPARQLVAVVAQERQGRVISYRTGYSR